MGGRGVSLGAEGGPCRVEGQQGRSSPGAHMPRGHMTAQGSPECVNSSGPTQVPFTETYQGVVACKLANIAFLASLLQKEPGLCGSSGRAQWPLPQSS